MGAFLAKIRTEPVRAAVYPPLVLLVGFLVVHGRLDSDVANIALGAIPLLIGVPAAEAARAKVTPTVKIPDVVAAGTQAALSQAEGVVADRFGQQGVEVIREVQAQVDEYVGRHRKAS